MKSASLGPLATLNMGIETFKAMMKRSKAQYLPINGTESGEKITVKL